MLTAAMPQPSFWEMINAGLGSVERRLWRWGEQCGMPEVAEHVLAVPGKRLRARMTLIASFLSPEHELGWPSDHLTDATAGVELVHEASLIHDDITLNSRLRRGRPTVMALFGVRKAAIAGAYFAVEAIRLISAEARGRPGPLRVLSGISALARGRLLEQVAPAVSGWARATDRWRRHPVARVARPRGASEESSRGRARVARSRTAPLFILACRVGLSASRAASDVRIVTALEGYAGHYARAFRLWNDESNTENHGAPEIPKEIRAEIRHQTAVAIESLDAIPEGPAKTELASMARVLAMESHR